jgi:hypothetical protein
MSMIDETPRLASLVVDAALCKSSVQRIVNPVSPDFVTLILGAQGNVIVAQRFDCVPDCEEPTGESP